ncbi:MAG: SnoaL-like domain-containing protein [Bacteroidota bacterium]
MSVSEIAHRLIALLREKKFIEAQIELYHEDIISIEPEKHPFPKTVGKNKLIEKERKFLQSIAEWHEFEVSEPLVAKNHFSLRMLTRISLMEGETLEIDEIILYEVEHNKIISEKYFY